MLTVIMLLCCSSNSSLSVYAGAIPESKAAIETRLLNLGNQAGFSLSEHLASQNARKGDPSSGTGGNPQPPSFSARTLHDMGRGANNGDPNVWPAEAGNFILTRGSQWHDIRSDRVSQNKAMATKFISQEDNTLVVIDISAKVKMDDANQILSFRVLVDGEPVEPGEIVLSHGPQEAVRSFSFTTTADRGIHVVEGQWKVPEGATAYIEDASIQVRQSGWSNMAGIVSETLETNVDPSWSDVPGLGATVWAEAGRSFTITFSAEAWMSDEQEVGAVRATVNGLVASPSEVAFMKGSFVASRSMTFVGIATQTGNQEVRIQWSVPFSGTASLRKRSLVVDVGRIGEAIGRAAIISGGYPSTASNSYTDIPGYSVVGFVPDNGEVVATFSGELHLKSGTKFWMALTIDGKVMPDQEVVMTTGNGYQGVHSFTFQTKHFNTALGPATNLPKVGLAWKTDGEAMIGEAVFNILAKYGDVPDAARSPEFGSPRVEPLVGTIPVATVIWKIDLPGVANANVQAVESAMFLQADSSADFFQRMSGGKFGITNAGVFEVDSQIADPDYYWDFADTANWSGGHQRSWAEAVDFLATQIDLPSYDTNKDGVLSPLELAIVIVKPQDGFQGSRELLVPGPNLEYHVVDNLIVPFITEIYNNQPFSQTGGYSHELSHLMLGTLDLYSLPFKAGDPLFGVFGFNDPGFACTMSKPSSTNYLSAPLRFSLGWLAPFSVTKNGIYDFQRLDQSYETHVLPRLDGGDGLEYFLLEFHESGVVGGGIIVWHVVEGPDEDIIPICMGQDADQTAYWDRISLDDHSRRGIRIVKPAVSSGTFWDSTDYTLSSGGLICPGGTSDAMNSLDWADGTPSGYTVWWLDEAVVTNTVLSTQIAVP